MALQVVSTFREQQSWALPPTCSSNLSWLGRASVQRDREERPQDKKQQRDPQHREAFLLHAVARWSQVPCRGCHTHGAGVPSPAQGSESSAQRVTSWRTGLSAVMRHGDMTGSQPSLTGDKPLSSCPPGLSDCKLLTPIPVHTVPGTTKFPSLLLAFMFCCSNN